VQFSSHLNFNNAHQLLQFRNLKLRGGGLNLNATGNYDLNTKNLKTSLEIKTFNLSQVLSTFNVTLPKKMHDKKVSFFTHLAFNGHEKLMDFSQLNFRVDPLNLNAKGRYHFGKEHLTLAVKIDPFNAVALLPTFGVVFPEMVDKTALTKVSLDLKLQGDKALAEIQSLRLEVDETLLQGRATVKHWPDPTISFDVSINKMNADRYKLVQKPSVKAAVSSGSMALGMALMPIEALRKINASGKIFMGELTVNDLTIHGINLQLDAEKGLVFRQNKIIKTLKTAPKKLKKLLKKVL
jgi:AsmA protein